MTVTTGPGRVSFESWNFGKRISVVIYTTTLMANKSISKRIVTERLLALGFGEYEVKVYVALLIAGLSSGYQLAKTSGVPRANVYGVLERLKQRGAVQEVDADGAVKYQAISAEEMLSNLSRSFQRNVDDAKKALKDAASGKDEPLAWNMNGYEALLAKAEEAIRSARSNLLVAVWPAEASRLTDALRDALGRGIKPTVLCLYGCESECGSCAGHIYRYPTTAKTAGRSLVVAVDERVMVIGDIEEDGSAVGAHSLSGVMVGVASQYIRNAIAASEIVRSLGPRLLEVVDAGALEAIKGAGLSIDRQSWFEKVFASVQKKQENQ
jgi:HTH-type transcriptional regulator, sugar sensing transcriptional regulator